MCDGKVARPVSSPSPNHGDYICQARPYFTSTDSATPAMRSNLTLVKHTLTQLPPAFSFACFITAATTTTTTTTTSIATTTSNNNRIERRNLRFLRSSNCDRNCRQHVPSSSPGHNGVQITCNTSSAYHVQPAVCHLVQRDSSAISFDRVEIAFILALFHWPKPLTDGGGEETGVPGENP